MSQIPADSTLNDIVREYPPNDPSLLTDDAITMYHKAEVNIRTQATLEGLTATGTGVAIASTDGIAAPFVAGAAAGITENRFMSDGKDDLNLALAHIYGGSANVPIDQDRIMKIVLGKDITNGLEQDGKAALATAQMYGQEGQDIEDAGTAVNNNLTDVAKDQANNALDDTERQAANAALPRSTPDQLNANNVSFLDQYAQETAHDNTPSNSQPLTLNNARDNSQGLGY